MLEGWMIFFRGLSVCRKQRRLWIYLIPPILLNLLVFIGLFYLGAEYLTPAFLDVLQRWIGDIPAFLRYLVMGLFIYVFYLFVVYFFNAFGLLVGGVFYTAMASRYLRLLAGGPTSDATPGGGVFEASWRQVLRYEIIKFVFLSVGGGVVTVLSWIFPYLSFVFLILLVLLLAYEYFDYAFEGLRLSYGARLSWIRRSLWTFFSAGLVVYLILSVPLIGFLFSPICVVGATDLVLSRQTEGPRV